jgi:DNA-binding MarR family transcriptional regulator
MAGRVEARLKQAKFKNTEEAAFIGLLVASEQVRQRLDELCAAHGITHVQYNVLRILRGAHPEGHPRFEIANRLIAKAPDVTRLLDRLDRLGLIERTWRPDNRRQSIARITGKGLDLLKTIDPRMERIVEHTMRKLTRDQVQQLARACDALMA